MFHLIILIQIKIIYAGLFGIAQGLDQILLSAKILKDENIQMILIGDGPEKDNLNDLKSKLDLKNISFVAPQKRDKGYNRLFKSYS